MTCADAQAPCPPEDGEEWDTWVWDWISVARPERALKYVPVRVFVNGRLLQSPAHTHTHTVPEEQSHTGPPRFIFIS